MADVNHAVSLDEFLTTQDAVISRFLATIERSQDDTKVRVTPWSETEGCPCDASIVIPKSAIASVVPTDKQHECCGKVRKVVELVFAAGSQGLIEDVVRQLSGKMRRLTDRQKAPMGDR